MDAACDEPEPKCNMIKRAISIGSSNSFGSSLRRCERRVCASLTSADAIQSQSVVPTVWPGSLRAQCVYSAHTPVSFQRSRLFFAGLYP